MSVLPYCLAVSKKACNECVLSNHRFMFELCRCPGQCALFALADRHCSSPILRRRSNVPLLGQLLPLMLQCCRYMAACLITKTRARLSCTLTGRLVCPGEMVLIGRRVLAALRSACACVSCISACTTTIALGVAKHIFAER